MPPIRALCMAFCFLLSAARMTPETKSSLLEAVYSENAVFASFLTMVYGIRWQGSDSSVASFS